MKIAHYADWRLTHALFFHEVSVHFYRTRACMPCRYHALLCSRSEVPPHESYRQSQTSYRWLHQSGFEIGGHLRVLDGGRSVAGVTLCSQILWRLLESSDCAALHYYHIVVWFASWVLSASRSWLHRVHKSLLHTRNRLTMTVPTDGAIPELHFCFQFRMDPGFVCCNNTG